MLKLLLTQIMTSSSSIFVLYIHRSGDCELYFLFVVAVGLPICSLLDKFFLVSSCTSVDFQNLLIDVEENIGSLLFWWMAGGLEGDDGFHRIRVKLQSRIWVIMRLGIVFGLVYFMCWS